MKNLHYIVPSHSDSCPPLPLDVHFVVDTSKSIKPDQFEKLKTALADLSDAFDIGPGTRQTRIAMVGFGKVAERYFDFDDHMDRASLRNAFANMERVEDFRGTETGKGIDLMMETFAGDFGNRPDAKDISIVFTDGKSTNPKGLKNSLENFANTDITQFAVGIGTGIDHAELTDIAEGDTDHVIEVTDFDSLVDLASEIASDVACGELYSAWLHIIQCGLQCLIHKHTYMIC